MSSSHEPSQPGSHMFDYKHVGGRFLGLVALAIVAFAAVGFGAFSDTKQFAFSYLFAFTFFLTICMGGLSGRLSTMPSMRSGAWSSVARQKIWPAS